ncbi:hypothetical protein PHYBLDRAFT_175112 [Phycomyces blakesleeanus NRRL 1555(-)]|uniref:DDE Tnp4 domain-containing protein n=1 Tax=Phycomyces blakesleeanus (strain ATCC 8743b / DSM 1359 / FGSC 10004 / NBRC 33097 / NRRL 1555) TaxID=763407 RepID=A0A162T6I0_PHYB8|nr:hypothetical protein PHYBLDRAFT_175112 [Phycomyces blakesleeanus NRRL 1555(-)]OAD66562.1 hypothetical protein PHYBLDRAFT_175112 [Phycomyces blakesleeanus NRRL 1555(-)]|eukprot:XP_018284602.1 hypothetical protein PHYBLDRAFT_175112 [Phycomyces blakesleeanus NRRL 1555(-)]
MHILLELLKQSLKDIRDAFKEKHDAYNTDGQLGCGYGSYNTFTDRFILIMNTIDICSVITWLNTIERVWGITTCFGQPTKSSKQRLKQVIGSMDGKLISIEKPTTENSGDIYADRRENTIMSLMAVCDYKKRFIHIATGTHGNYIKWELFLYSAYLLLPQLLTPFIGACGRRSESQETVPLTTEEKLCNTVQSRTQ